MAMWWVRDEIQKRRAALDVRIAVRRAVRLFFEVEGFEEVETPALQISPGLEPHLAAFRTEMLPVGRGRGEPQTFYLHTSPEFAMKKLLAGGMEKIWQIAPVFRNAEGGPNHSPEFRMLEWYRAGASYTELMEDTVALVRDAARKAGASDLRHRGLSADPYADWQRISVEQAFMDYAGIDLRPTFADASENPPPDRLRKEATRIGIPTADDDRFDDIFFKIFLEKIEPSLGHPAPTILYDYPVSMAALARPKPDDPMLAERFEVYVCGLELANAFGELTDATEQRRRFEADMDLKESLYGERYPIDEDFIAAVAQMPEAAGIALGIDRLVMLLAGVDNIDQTLWAPVDVT